MRNLLPDIATALGSENFQYYYLLELQTSVPLYFCDGEIPIVYSGHSFVPRGFKFSEMSGSSNTAVETIDIDIDDTDQMLAATVLNEDVRNKWAVLYLGVISVSVIDTRILEAGDTRILEAGDTRILEVGGTSIYVQEFMRGIIGGWELYDENMLRISITNELVLWNKKPLRIQQSSCPWTFKGTECGYTGVGATCDHTYAQCKYYGNQDNFGGDRYINAMREKVIWWGRTQKI